MPTKKNNRGLFSRAQLFFYAFSIILFAFVVYYFSEIKTGIKLFERIEIVWLIAAIAGQVATYLLGAMVYYALLKMFKHNSLPKFRSIVQANFVVLLFNQTVPSAQLSGNTYLLNFLIKRNVPLSHILSAIFLELITFYGAMELIILIVLGISLSMHNTAFIIILCAGFLVYLVFAISILFVGRQRSLSKVYNKVTSIKFFKKIVDRFTNSLPSENTDIHKMPNALTVMQKHMDTISTVIFYQLLLFLADAFTILALFYGLGIHIPIYYPLIGLILSKIISILPVSPGALILYESSMTFYFVQLGIPFGSSMIVTLLYRLLSFWMPMPIGFILYKKLQK